MQRDSDTSLYSLPSRSFPRSSCTFLTSLLASLSSRRDRDSFFSLLSLSLSLPLSILYLALFILGGGQTSNADLTVGYTSVILTGGTGRTTLLLLMDNGPQGSWHTWLFHGLWRTACRNPEYSNDNILPVLDQCRNGTTLQRREDTTSVAVGLNFNREFYWYSGKRELHHHQDPNVHITSWTLPPSTVTPTDADAVAVLAFYFVLSSPM